MSIPIAHRTRSRGGRHRWRYYVRRCLGAGRCLMAGFGSFVGLPLLSLGGGVPGFAMALTSNKESDARYNSKGVPK